MIATTDKRNRNRIRREFLPNTSPVPNFVFDDLLPDTEFPRHAITVFLFLLRKTVGWNKEFDRLSLENIGTGTGITDRHTVIYALRIICDCFGFFVREPGRGRAKTKYTIVRSALTKEVYQERVLHLLWVYDRIPTPEQLREEPCTFEVLAEGRRKMREYEAGVEAKHRSCSSGQLTTATAV